MSSVSLAKKYMIDLKGLTLRKFLRASDPAERERAGDISLQTVKYSKTKGGHLMVKTKALSASRPNLKFDTWFTFLDISEKSSVTEYCRVHAQCSCITGDTRVLTSKGWQTVFEIAQPYEDDYYPIKYNVDGELYEGSAPFYTGFKEVWKIQLSNGTSLTATKDHRFLKHIQGKGVKYPPLEEWVELGHLDVGDCLLTNEFDADIVERNDDFWSAFFIGILQGDGTVFAIGRPNLKLYGNKRRILKTLIRLDLVKDVSEVKGQDAINVQFTHRAIELAARFKFSNKQSVKLEDITQTMGYLSGLIATDGTTYEDGKILIRGGKEYLEQLFWKLMEYGYTQTTFYMERGIGISESSIDGKVLTSTKEMWTLKLSKQCNIIPNLFLYKYHRDRIKTDIQRPRKAWVKILSITHAARQHVYDITVPEVHRFTANGLIAHNCERYMYMWEVANTAHNAARIFYSNGEMPEEKNPTMQPGLCIAEGEKVSTLNGLIPIEKVVVGDLVHTLEGLRNVLSSECTGYKKVFKIALKNGSTLKCTYDHPILVLRKSTLKWVEAGELLPTDFVTQYRSSSDIKEYIYFEKSISDITVTAHNAVIPEKTPEYLDECLASLIGYMIAEGSPSLFANEKEVITEDFVTKFEKCFGYTPSVNKLGVSILTFVSKYFENIGLVYWSHLQEIPECILNSPDSVISAFLQSLYEGDGWITERCSTYGTKSQVLAEQLHVLLLSKGIYTHITINYSGVNKCKMHLVSTSSVNETQKLIELIKPLTKGKVAENNDATPSCEILPLDLDLVVKRLANFRLKLYRETLKGETTILDGITELGLNKTRTASYYLRKLELEDCEIEKGTKATNSKVRLLDLFDATYDETLFKTKLSISKELGIKNAKNSWPREDFSTKEKIRNLNTKSIDEKKFKRFFDILSHEDVVFTQVSSVDYAGKANVYDLTIDQAHHFIANGIVVHNCKHLVALANEILNK